MSFSYTRPLQNPGLLYMVQYLQMFLTKFSSYIQLFPKMYKVRHYLLKMTRGATDSYSQRVQLYGFALTATLNMNHSPKCFITESTSNAKNKMAFLEITTKKIMPSHCFGLNYITYITFKYNHAQAAASCQSYL